jgi:uncharacterized protein (DUF1697 family)
MSGMQVALLRGINVGRAKRIAMADLRALVESFGYGSVRTLLNSGNVIFHARGVKTSESAARIEEGIANKLGVSARVIVLSAAEVAAIVKENPLLEIADDHARLLVSVLISAEDRRHLQPLTKQDWAPEALALGPKAAYLWCADGIIASKLQAAVERALSRAVTSRNWATMIKIQALME